MKVLKFKLHDKKGVQVAEIRLGPDYGYQLQTTGKGQASFKLSDKHFTWRQYTGLKDKNGKEIYEGDIVQPYMNGLKVEAQVIKYLDHGFTVCDLDTTDSMDGIWYYDMEVIGNIYENPELLV